MAVKKETSVCVSVRSDVQRRKESKRLQVNVGRSVQEWRKDYERWMGSEKGKEPVVDDSKPGALIQDVSDLQSGSALGRHQPQPEERTMSFDHLHLSQPHTDLGENHWFRLEGAAKRNSSKEHWKLWRIGQGGDVWNVD